MFGIGIQEMLLIFVVALIVIGPDKLPDLARSLAKGFVEIRKTLEQAKESLNLESDMLESVKQDLKESSDKMREVMIETKAENWRRASGPVPEPEDEDEIIDVEKIPESHQDISRSGQPESSISLRFPDRQSSGHGSAYALPEADTRHFSADDKTGQTPASPQHHD